jgi:uncharacterized protein (TIGR02231 family)
MAQLTSTIVAAYIYPDRARLTRRGTINLKAGVHSIELSELPPSLDPDSLRASVFGTARARLLGARVSRSYYQEAPSDKVKQIAEEIEKLQDQIIKLEAQSELIKQTRTNLEKLTGQANIFATALAAGEMTIDKQLEIFNSIRKQAEKLDDENQEIQVNQRKANRSLEKLNKELEQLHSLSSHDRYTASVDVELLLASELTIEVSYIVGGVGWKPMYDLRLLEKEGNPSLEISYLAEVTQNTGEPWDEVSLSLSTARPALSRIRPELEPWFLSPPEPVRPIALAQVPAEAVPSSMARRTALKSLSPRGEVQNEKGERAEEGALVVNPTGISVSYLIPSTVSIPSDGAPHKVAITRFTLIPHIDYVAAPKQAQAVYRRAKMENDSPYTLLPGEANILVVDEYIGNTLIELTTPKGEIELYLGVENRLKVERDMKRRDVEKRVVGGKRSLGYGFEIKIESLLPSKANLVLLDNYPVPRHEEIKVKLDSAEPKPVDQSDLNLLKWELTLEPKEKRTVKYNFSVESPQGMDIIGLP